MPNILGLVSFVSSVPKAGVDIVTAVNIDPDVVELTALEVVTF